jgi:aminopeptidase-like protein
MKINEKKLYLWAKDLYPIHRSITGSGVRETLSYIKKILPALKIKKIPSGKKVYGWKVPKEWAIKEAYIKNSKGKKVVDLKNNNLHIISYSQSINKHLSLENLKKNLYSLKEQPKAIPYITSYYSKNWGFCISHEKLKKLKKDTYHVVINSSFKEGFLNYGELIIPGKSKEEILLTTNICHPSMGNNETSGIVVTTALAKFVSELMNRRYTYRIIFIPETIGSIAYIHSNKNKLKKRTKAGYVVVCVGDNKTYSFLASKDADTLSDRAALYALDKYIKKFKYYDFLERGSDERQFCSKGVDLPICSIMRSKYGTYPEYHTSLDDLRFISGKGLYGSFKILKKVLEIIEINFTYKNIYKNLCEPKLSDYNLRAPVSFKKTYNYDKNLLNILFYANGKRDLIELSKKTKVDIFEANQIINKLIRSKLIKKI